MKTLLSLALLSAIAVSAHCKAFRHRPGTALEASMLTNNEQIHFSRNKNRILEIRGGAGPIDPTGLAKWTTGLNLVNSIYSYLLPDKAIENYSQQAKSDMMVKMMKGQGMVLLGATVLAYCLVFQGTSINTAVGYANLPFIIELLRSELSGEREKMGMPKNTQFVFAAIHAVVAYGCFTSAEWANNGIKALTVWLGLNGLHASLFPSSAQDLWNVKLQDMETHMFRWFGLLALDMAVYVGCLAWGVVPMKALGYSYIPATLGNAYLNLLSDETKKRGLNRSALAAWMVLGLVTIGTLSF